MSHSPEPPKVWRLEGWCVIGDDGPLLYTFTEDRKTVDEAESRTAAFWGHRQIAKVRLEITEVAEQWKDETQTL